MAVYNYDGTNGPDTLLYSKKNEFGENEFGTDDFLGSK